MRAVLVDVDGAVADVARGLAATGLVVDLADAAQTRAALSPGEGDEPYWLVVNNAGVFSKTPLLKMALDEWDRVHRVNVRSMVVVMQALVPAMIAAGAGGRIVNVASMAAKLGTPGEAAYAASKAAVVALSRIAAMEFGPHGVPVNAICPALGITDIVRDNGPKVAEAMGLTFDEMVDLFAQESAVQRPNTVEEIAAMAVLLASDAGAGITGATLSVDGGTAPY